MGMARLRKGGELSPGLEKMPKREILMGNLIPLEAYEIMRLMEQCQKMLANEEPNMLPLRDIIRLCEEVMDYRAHDSSW